MREGRLQGELGGADATEEAVMHLATHACYGDARVKQLCGTASAS